MTDGDSDSLAIAIRGTYLAWLASLQALTAEPLKESDWTGRHFEGLTPAEALAVGPDADAAKFAAALAEKGGAT